MGKTVENGGMVSCEEKYLSDFRILNRQLQSLWPVISDSTAAVTGPSSDPKEQVAVFSRWHGEGLSVALQPA
ncbi:MAG: hypothetical protein ABSC77_10895 [Terracidiphilus sp.]